MSWKQVTKKQKINGKIDQERQKSRCSYSAPFSKTSFSTDSLTTGKANIDVG
jgi:hypothetical protein